jgi:hypothetical protein
MMDYSLSETLLEIPGWEDGCTSGPSFVTCVIMPQPPSLSHKPFAVSFMIHPVEKEAGERFCTMHR